MNEVTKEAIAECLTQMGEGLTLKQVLASAELPYMKVWHKINGDKELSEMYARAREAYAHSIVQKLHEVARNEPDVQRARLQCDNIKWEACKVLPKVYGDKIEANHTGEVGLTINVVKFSDNDSE